MKVTDDDLSPIETVSNDKIFVDSTIDDDAVDDDQFSMSMSLSIPEDVSALNEEEVDDSRYDIVENCFISYLQVLTLPFVHLQFCHFGIKSRCCSGCRGSHYVCNYRLDNGA